MEPMNLVENVSNDKLQNDTVYQPQLLGKADNNQIDDEPQISPVGVLTLAGFGLLMFMLASTLLCYISPFWYQTWPDSFNNFQNLGLWEVCFSDYIHPKDDTMHIYSGCYHIFGSDPSITKLREWLAPPWFLACNILMTTSLIIEVVSIAVFTVIFMHRCPIIDKEYHEIYGLFVISSFMFLNVLLLATVAGLFASQYDSRNWMPRPDLNFLSWGYFMCLTSAMFGIFSGAGFYIEARHAYFLILKREEFMIENIEQEITEKSAVMDQTTNSLYKPLASYQTHTSFALSPDFAVGLQPSYQSAMGAPALQMPMSGYSSVGFQPLAGLHEYHDSNYYDNPRVVGYGQGVVPSLGFYDPALAPVYNGADYQEVEHVPEHKESSTRFVEEYEYVS